MLIKCGAFSEIACTDAGFRKEIARGGNAGFL